MGITTDNRPRNSRPSGEEPIRNIAPSNTQQSRYDDFQRLNPAPGRRGQQAGLELVPQDLRNYSNAIGSVTIVAGPASPIHHMEVGSE